MSAIRGRITEEIKEAMKAKAADRLATLRMIKAEILKKETGAGAGELDEAGLIQLLGTMKKQREESMAQFAAGGRADLADRERVEIAVLETFLPAQLSDAELDRLVADALAESGAKDPKGMGAAMKIAVAKAAGRADNKRISERIKARLGG